MTSLIQEHKTVRAHPRPKMAQVAVVVLGGGRGKRLFPLTQTRCKPAITFGGRYRLIDVPVSNALGSGCNKIFILTQFLSSSIHRHILQTYQMSGLSTGFIDVLAAEQKPSLDAWYQGTADALRQHVASFRDVPCEYFLILSGDQLYNMDFRDLVEQAKSTDADLTVATLPVGRKAASRMGVMHVDESGKIERFVEKPKDPALLDEFVSPYLTSQKKPYLASMGIYLYKRKALLKQLETSQGVDFGMHLIPEKVAEGRAFAYVYHGYWEDIGTIGTFYKANMDLAKKNPPFDLYRDEAQVFSHVYHLPGARIVSAKITESIICEGSIVEAKEVTGSILGPRSLIGEGAVIDHTYMMGNDSYAPPVKDSPSYPSSFEVGENSVISGAILDKHVRIGKNVQLINKKKLEEYDSPDGTLYVRDGVIIVTRGSEIPDGFEF